MEQEEDDFDDEHVGEEEEEESENEEEDGEEVGEEENGDGQNDNKGAEMEELEKEYMNLRHQEQDILKKDLKGQAVKNQKALWNKALEFRFLLQKAFSSSHGIMDYHRYNVYEKIVNFMAPETMVISPMLSYLNNLFGLKKQKPASVV
ncbi:protein AATF-like [Pyrus x bretschneideri]|uniref:protein AATF-like n=1 Tax=Pyrus x bretschneideri TaxID=225117 RepID=UPI002030B3EB|nr:protein AATF-like [Pyrus x bretschneideri]